MWAEVASAGFTYDAKGRLASVELSDGTGVRFRYGFTGQRVVKEVTGPGGTHRTVYADHLFEERAGEAVDYVFAGERRVAQGWMWGDLGRLYFWIKRGHLAARRFDRVWTILQCG